MARKWNTDTFTFCVVKRNMRNRVLSLAIPLNILTRQLRNNDMGDGFYYDFFHVWLQRVRLKKKWWVLKLALVSSLSPIMVALENTDFFSFYLPPFRQKLAEAAGYRRDKASWGAPGSVPSVWEWHRWTWWPSGVTQIKTDNRAGRHADRRGSWWVGVHADSQSRRQTDRQADVITDRFIFGIARWGYVSWGFKPL